MQALAYFIYLIVFIYLCIKGKIRWVAFLALLLSSISALTISIILMYAMPESLTEEISYAKFIPVIVSVLLAISAFYSLKPGKRTNSLPTKDPSIFRWLGFVMGILLSFGGLVLFSFYINVSEQPSPSIGTISYLVLFSASILLFYLVSRMNTIKRPNLLRWIILCLGIFIYQNCPMIVSLILIYSVNIGPQQVPFPFWAVIATLGYIPYGLLITGLAKDYVSGKEM